MLKKLMLACLVACTLTVSASAFDDIPATHWAYDYVTEMSDRHVIEGYDDGDFYSSATISTAEYLVMLARCAQLEIVATDSDVWYGDYLDACQEAGIVLEGEVENAQSPILRKDSALFTQRALGATEVTGQQWLVTAIADYEDIADTKYAQPVLMLYALGVVQGDGQSKFNPDATITRGEAAAVLCRGWVEQMRLSLPVVQEIPILMYHEVGQGDTYLYVSVGNFAAQLDYLLENGYNTVTMAQIANHWLYNAPLPENPVALTFDDGYVSMYETVMPMLLERGQTATFFIIDEGSHWSPLFVTYDQIKEMSDAGLEIGSHSLFHIALADESDAVVEENLVTSKANLEGVIGKAVTALAYPYGSVDQAVVAIAQAAGYEIAVTIESGLATADQDVFQLNRMDISGYDALSVFAQKLKGID